MKNKTFIRKLCIVAVFPSILLSQNSIMLFNASFESSPLLAPVLLYVIPIENNNTYTLGVLGWTMSGEWKRNIGASSAFFFSTEITPINSHSSNSIYQNGKQNASLEYSNRTIQLKSGISLQHTPKLKSEFSLIGLHEFIGKISDVSVTQYWKNPFFGIELAERYSNTTSEDYLRFRSNGINLSEKFSLLTGSTTWWKNETSIGAGKKFGDVFLNGSGIFLLGNSLNIVNQFLIGGSWNMLDKTKLHGYHYAEFRLSRALIFNGCASMRVYNSLEFAVEASYLSSPTKTTYGESFKSYFEIAGLVCYAGIAFPENKFAINKAVVSAGISSAIIGM